MKWKQPHHVVVHDVSEQHQKEDQADLNKALFESHAEIAAANAFQGEQQDVSAIENRNGQQVEDAKVQAQRSHQRDYGKRAFLHGLARFGGDADDTLELLGGKLA